MPARRISTDPERLLRSALVIVAAGGLAAGLAAWWASGPAIANPIWAVATVPVVIALGVEIVVSLSRREVGLDIVAFLSMSGALVLGEMLAGCVVALMYAGGEYLEAFAAGRARREMTALLSRVPKTAMRYEDSILAEVPIAAIVPGDRILVRQGEVVPVDGTVARGEALLDLSALTGESIPVTLGPGADAPSGSANQGAAFDQRASRTRGTAIVVTYSAQRRAGTSLAAPRRQIEQ